MKTENIMFFFFKRQDSCHEMHILGFEIEDGAKIIGTSGCTDKKN